MVNWRDQYVVSDIGNPYYRNHGDYLFTEKEAQLMASKKRPPLAWDIDKQGMPKMPIRIFLNQKEVNNVISYDAEAGWLLKYKQNAKGNIMLDNHGNVIMQKLNGSILIVRQA